MSVEWVRVGDIAVQNQDVVTVEPGQTYKTLGVLNRGRGLFERTPLSGAETQYPKFTRVNPGQLVYSKLFGWEGSVAVVREGLEGFVVSPEFPVFDLGPDADAAYISHAVAWGGFVEQMASATTGLGQRRQRVNVSDFVQLKIPLPPIDEQRRIAAHLDSLSEVSDASRAGRAVNLPLEHSVVRSAARVGVATRVGDILKLDRPWIDLEEDVLYSAIGVRGFGRGLIVYPPSTSRGLSKMRYFGVRPERLVVSNIKAWEGAVTRTDGRHASLVGSNRFLQYEVTSGEVLLDWVQAYFASPQGTEALAAASPGSADRNRTLSIKTFEEIAIPVPSLSVQTEATALISQARQVARLAARAATVAGALLPAARNEIFTAMR